MREAGVNYQEILFNCWCICVERYAGPMSIQNIHDFLFLKLRLFRMTKYILCLLFTPKTIMKRRRTIVITWGILVYDDFNHNAIITMSAGHDDTMNYVTTALDREGSKSICDFSPDALENAFHFCIMIFS